MSEKKIPRPRNAFILFRQHHHRLLIDEWTVQGVDIPHNSKISKILGVKWKSLNEEERSHWEEQAKKEKCEHEKKYPDYRYKPTRRHRRKNSKQISALTTAATSSSSSSASPQVPIRVPLQPQQQQQQHMHHHHNHPHVTSLSAVTNAVSSPVQQSVSVHRPPPPPAPAAAAATIPPALAPQLTPMHNVMAQGPAAGQLRPLPYPMAASHNPTPMCSAYYSLPLQGGYFTPKFAQVTSSQVAQATPPTHHTQIALTGQPLPAAAAAAAAAAGIPSSLPSSLPPASAIAPPPPIGQEAGRVHNWQWRNYVYPFDRR